MISKLRINRKTMTPAKACCLRVPTSVFRLCNRSAGAERHGEHAVSWHMGRRNGGVGILNFEIGLLCDVYMVGCCQFSSCGGMIISCSVRRNAPSKV